MDDVVQVFRSANSGDHVFALGIDEVFAHRFGFAGRTIAGECHAGRAVVAHVSKDHRLHVDGGADQAGDLVEDPVLDRPIGLPRIKYGVDRILQLLHRILRKR